jgi:hypothetical protein
VFVVCFNVSIRGNIINYNYISYDMRSIPHHFLDFDVIVLTFKYPISKLLEIANTAQ